MPECARCSGTASLRCTDGGCGRVSSSTPACRPRARSQRTCSADECSRTPRTGTLCGSRHRSSSARQTSTGASIRSSASSRRHGRFDEGERNEVTTMETFAVMAFFGLGLTVLVMLGHRYVTFAREGWAFITIALGIGLAWLADLNMWALWGVLVREPWIGVTLTGLARAAR